MAGSMTPSAKNTVARMIRKLKAKLRNVEDWPVLLTGAGAGGCNAAHIAAKPSVGEDHQQHGRREEVDAVQALGVVHALALDEENRQREHEHVVHRPFAKPFQRPQLARQAADLTPWQCGQQQQVEQLQDGQENEKISTVMPRKILTGTDQGIDRGDEGVLVGEEYELGQLDDRQADAERQAHAGRRRAPGSTESDGRRASCQRAVPE